MEPVIRHPVPVFPLPATVLFPRTALPLHVFEPRYRAMVRDALSGPRQLVITLLKPGWERDYAGSPEYHALGCLARCEEVEWLPNDCYDLRVTGLTRVRLGRVTREFPYRAARVEPVPQQPYTEHDPLVQIEKRALVGTLERLLALVRAAARAQERRAREEAGEAVEPEPGAATADDLTVDPAATYETVVNTLCTLAPFDAEDKLALLELDSVIERGHLIREWTERWMVQPRPELAPKREDGGEWN